MTVPRPLSLLCELTYRCNLQCPYCYNPVDYDTYRDELDTQQWCDVVAQAAQLGIVQLHLSGGEPTLRRDLPQIVEHAARAGLYVNLITQGTFLDERRLDELIASGLAHVQISVQAPEALLADEIAGTRVHEKKIEALRLALSRDVAVTLNCVLHRLNHDSIEDVIGLAESLGVRRLELANVQFYGWAFRNRLALMPTRAQVEHGVRVVEAARERLGNRMQITYVLPDYFEERPKPCMHGWGNAFMTVAPTGRVLPCPAAAAITTLPVENIRDRSLREIWERSELFNAYRGTEWMPEPCRSCERREIDWGGCRCQAFLLTGNAGVTDPACELSSQHDLVLEWREDRRPPPFDPRRPERAVHAQR
jgi:pyrroloquinoline quinone biosynthesis protein E